MSVIEKISVQGTDYDIKDTAVTKQMEGLLAPSLELSDLKANTEYIIRLIFPDNSDNLRNNYCYITWSGFAIPDMESTQLNHFAEIRFTPMSDKVTLDTNATYYHIAQSDESYMPGENNQAVDAGEIFCLHSLIEKCMKPSELTGIVYGTSTEGGQTFYSIATPDSLGGGHIARYQEHGVESMPMMGENYTLPVGDPVGKYDAVPKKYADRFACYEQEREVPYGTWTEFHNRDYNGEALDIDQVEFSCILHDETGGYCYVSHDITRMVQAVPDDGSKGVYKLTGVYADFNSDAHKTYSFKITIRRTGYKYEIYPERLFIGNLCKEVNGGNVSMTTIKTRTIFTRYIKEI